jgi:hypothetical protein
MTTSFDLDSKKSSTGTLPPHIWAARISHIQRRWMVAFHSRHTVRPRGYTRLGFACGIAGWVILNSVERLQLQL